MVWTELEEKALKFATKSHENQTRKTGEPFIYHPIEVAKILKDANFDERVVAAGFLHDVVEDTDVTLEEVYEEFGEEVTKIVQSNTEDKTKTWLERKAHTHHAMVFSNLEKRALLIADKKSNINALAIEKIHNNQIDWSKFKKGYEEQKWYFKTIALGMEIGLEKEEIPTFFHEFAMLVDTVFVD